MTSEEDPHTGDEVRIALRVRAVPKTRSGRSLPESGAIQVLISSGTAISVSLLGSLSDRPAVRLGLVLVAFLLAPIAFWAWPRFTGWLKRRLVLSAAARELGEVRRQFGEIRANLSSQHHIAKLDAAEDSVVTEIIRDVEAVFGITDGRAKPCGPESTEESDALELVRGKSAQGVSVSGPLPTSVDVQQTNTQTGGSSP